ncbi:MAG: hypothetical protein ACI4OU_02670 [Candidatus Enterenecus sp.]
MSASREKKQRQGADPIGKVTQAQQEQAAYKKKVRLYTVIGVIIVVLVAALLIWNSGIFQRRATAATVGEHKLSVGELSYFYTDARYLYAAYGILDTSKADDEQYYNEAEGVTYRDYFMDSALANAKETLALYDAAIAAGYSVKDIQEDLDAQIASVKSGASSSGYSNYASYIQAIYGRYTTTSAFEKALSYTLLANLYYNDVYGEQRDSYSVQELEDYYAEHTDDVDTFTYSYLYFKADTVSPTNDDGSERSDEEIDRLKDDAMDAAKENAELALAFYQNGDKTVADLIEEREPTTSGDHTSVTGSSSISSVYRDALLELEPDEATVVEYENNGWYVVIYHGRERNEELPASIRNIYVAAETTTDAEGTTVAPTDEAWAAAEQKANELLSQWKSGEQTAESFGELAEANGMSSGGLSTGITSATTSLGDALRQWLFEEERSVGDTTVTRYESSSNYGCYVTYLQEWEEAVWAQNVRSTLTQDAIGDWLDELSGGYDTALTDGAKHIGT